MSKKVDISKLLTKGSARQRAALLMYHYTISEAIEVGGNYKPILTEDEAKAILNSFKTQREINVYNEYGALHKEFIQQLKIFNYKVMFFEKEYYKYLYYSSNIDKRDAASLYKNTGLFNETDSELQIAESILIEAYKDVVNYYAMLNLYAKETGYTNEYVLANLKKLFNNLRSVYNEYKVGNIIGDLSEIEPDLEEVKNLLLREFNYKYEEQ